MQILDQNGGCCMPLVDLISTACCCTTPIRKCRQRLPKTVMSREGIDVICPGDENRSWGEMTLRQPRITLDSIN